MARFLSEAWFQAIAASAEPVRPVGEAGFTVQQVVTDTPEGEVSYAVQVADAGGTVVLGHVSDPDVTFVENYSTAVAVARGELSAEAALLAGQIRITGDLARLAKQQGTFVDDLLPPAVRAATSY